MTLLQINIFRLCVFIIVYSIAILSLFFFLKKRISLIFPIQLIFQICTSGAQSEFKTKQNEITFLQKKEETSKEKTTKTTKKNNIGKSNADRHRHRRTEVQTDTDCTQECLDVVKMNYNARKGTHVSRVQ